MVLLLSITGAGLIFSGTGLRTAGAFRAGTQAFYVADTGISQAVSQLESDQTAATAAFSGDLGGGITYRSGRRNDSGPQPLVPKGQRTPTGYSVGAGTERYGGGNESAGALADWYQVNVTGTGPIGAAREIEAQVEFGPLPRN